MEVITQINKFQETFTDISSLNEYQVASLQAMQRREEGPYHRMENPVENKTLKRNKGSLSILHTQTSQFGVLANRVGKFNFQI
ncbi:MAG: hypothetical protein EOP45_07200 [Sphingobacteriaceae bacterium]|nr:MAG: hypothetical protein EOP45_07200 [Sphingobacteriaceae bacterium]